MAACFIYFFHVELVMCQLPVIIFALWVLISLYNPQERWNKCLIWVLSRSPFMFPIHALHIGISSCLGYTFWKLAWRSLDIAKQTLHVYCHVNLFFGGGVVFICPPKLTNTKPTWLRRKRPTWLCRLSDVFLLSPGATDCHAYGTRPF